MSKAPLTIVSILLCGQIRILITSKSVNSLYYFPGRIAMNYRIPHKVFILISVLLQVAVSLSSSFDGRNKNLTEIPTLDDLPATITSLDFSYNNIEIVHPITPQHPPLIKEVILSHNKIHTIVRGL
jgi:Leucine-rich repeat (LRR) protein